MHQTVACATAFLLLTTPLSAATIDYSFSATQPGGGIPITLQVSPPDASPASQTVEVSAPPVAFSLPRFDPAMGTLTRAELIYRLTDTTPVGRNSILATLDRNCGGIDNCNKTLSVSPTFFYGLDVEGIENPNVPPVDGRNIDLLLDSFGRGSGGSASTDGDMNILLALSGFTDGLRRTARFTSSSGSLDTFIGTDDLMITAEATTRFLGDLRCTPTGSGPLPRCSEDLEVFLLPSFEVELRYDFEPEIPMPRPIPMPAGLPLLVTALGLFALLRRQRS